MLSTYFKRQSTITKLYDTLVGQHLDEYSDWLSQRGYRDQTVLYYIRGVVHLSTWLQRSGLSINKISSAKVKSFAKDFLAGQLRPTRKKAAYIRGAYHYITFLEHKGLITPRTNSADGVQYRLQREFEQWMRVHRGIQNTTLANYRRYVSEFLKKYGATIRTLTARKIRNHVRNLSQTCGISTTKCRVNAIRAFLKFLIATDRCDSSMGKVIPPIAQWKLASLPRYISAEEVDRVISTCDCSSNIGIRNKAVVLLLARLGLRASEVSGLELKSIDWKNGTLSVIGKNRREARLPLSQEVGDALLNYLRVRPSVDCKFVFIRAVAPWVGVTRSAVSSIAGNAIRKAGIDSPSYGSHVLRHSAATSLLRQGSSLQTIGELLRHASIETTAHYAKVDTSLLSTVVSPWPGGVSC